MVVPEAMTWRTVKLVGGILATILPVGGGAVAWIDSRTETKAEAVSERVLERRLDPVATQVTEILRRLEVISAVQGEQISALKEDVGLVKRLVIKDSRDRKKENER